MEARIEEINKKMSEILAGREDMRTLKKEEKEALKTLQEEKDKLQEELANSIKDENPDEIKEEKSDNPEESEDNPEEEMSEVEGLSPNTLIIYDKMMADSKIRNDKFAIVQKYARVIDEEIKELEVEQKAAKRKFESLEGKFTIEENNKAHELFLKDKEEDIKDRLVGLGHTQARIVRGLIR